MELIKGDEAIVVRVEVVKDLVAFLPRHAEAEALGQLEELALVDRARVVPIKLVELGLQIVFSRRGLERWISQNCMY